MKSLVAKPSRSRIIPALIHIQTHLADDLSLDLLADEAKLSRYHFHELFCKVTGETPRSYVERLRLERAALQLRIRQSTVLEIALECGYQNHETFTRAFRNRFGMSPREYRRGWPRVERTEQRFNSTLGASRLSPTRIVSLAKMIVGFIRFTGAYESVAMSAIERISAWGESRGIAPQQQILLGIAHDAPGTTSAEKLRYDCCVQVPHVFDADGEVAWQRTAGGLHALTDYVGTWDWELAYRAIFERLKQMSSIEIIGLPAIEFYQAGPWDQSQPLSITLAVPVRRKPG